MILYDHGLGCKKVSNLDRNYRFLILFINKLINGNYVLVVIIGRLFYGSYQFHIFVHDGETKFSKFATYGASISQIPLLQKT